MSLEEVHIPSQKHKGDPKEMTKDKHEEPGYYDKQIKELRAKREFAEEKKLLDSVENPPEAPEAPFKVTGSVNLGNYDLQQQNREAQEVITRERQQTQQKIDELQTKNEEITRKLHDTEVKAVEDKVMRAVDDLNKKLDAGTKPADLADDFDRVIKLLDKVPQFAEKLGFKQPDPTTGSGANALAIKKLDLELEERRQSWEAEKIKNEREWNMAMEKLKMEQQKINNELIIEREKMNRWDNLPKQIGSVVAKGIIDGTKNQTGQSITEQQQTKQPRRAVVTAKPGDAGEMECPVCKNPIAIGPTAKKAICAVCGLDVTIDRKEEVPEEERDDETSIRSL